MATLFNRVLRQTRCTVTIKQFYHKSLLIGTLGYGCYLSSGVTVEPVTKTEFEDELIIPTNDATGGILQSLNNVGHYTQKKKSWNNFFNKEKGNSSSFAIGEYQSLDADSNDVIMTTFRLKFVKEMSGSDLRHLLEPLLNDFCQNISNKYRGNEVTSTRGGTLFFTTLENMTFMQENEIFFVCNEKDHQLSILSLIDGRGPYSLFAVKSEIVCDSLKYVLRQMH